MNQRPERAFLRLMFGAVVLLCLSACRADSRNEALPNHWQVASAPSVILGTDDSGFTFNKVNSAVRLSDGRIVVADGGLRSRLSLFTGSGEYVGPIGGSGDGPGEFWWITSVQVGPNDSLFVFDRSLQRLTVYSRMGHRERTAAFRGSPHLKGADGLSRVTRLSDGIWFGLGAESLVEGPIGEIVRDTIIVALIDGKLDNLNPLGYLAGLMTTTTLLQGSPVFRPPPFTPQVIAATWGRCIFTSNAESPSITVYSSSGEAVSSIQGPGTPRRVSEEHLQVRLEHDLRTYGREQEQLQRELLFSEARPNHLPYYQSILADQWGHLWLQEYVPPLGVGRHWYIVAQSGEQVGEIFMPKGMTLFSVTENGVLARTQGEHDVDLVELWSWAAPPSPTAGPLAECVSP